MKVLPCRTKNRTKSQIIKESICTAGRDQILCHGNGWLLRYTLGKKWNVPNVDLSLFSLSWKKTKCYYSPSPFQLTLCIWQRHVNKENIFLYLYSPCRDLDNSKIHLTNEMVFISYGICLATSRYLEKSLLQLLLSMRKNYCHKVYVNMYLNNINNKKKK